MDHQAALSRAAAALGLAVAMVVSCKQTASRLPPLGEVLVVVDTDLPAPAIASHLRVDLYAEDGTWYESRSLAVPDPTRWPLSFSVYSSDESKDTRVLVRLRVYPDGRERDYRGERYEPLLRDTGSDAGDDAGTDAGDDAGAPDAGPRLNRGDDAGSATPVTEPLPRLTVDRLVLLRVTPGVRGRVVAVLRGACAGTMARLANESYAAPIFGQARTCTDTEGVTTPLTEERLDSDLQAPVPSQVNTFGAEQPCAADAGPNAVCIHSGAFILGGPRFGDVNVTSTMPDRVVRMSRFYIDREEVTVARYRDALTGPPTELVAAPDTFQPLNGSACPFTTLPGPQDALPMACLSWDGARAYCQGRGGDLPTEAQWEFAATTGDPRYKPRFPWGDDDPACDGATFGRAYANVRLDKSPTGRDCVATATRPPGPRVAPSTGDQDVSALGILGLAGGVSEWTLDAAFSYSDDCWRLAPTRDPECVVPGRNSRSVRGGSWRSPPGQLDTLARQNLTKNEPFIDYVGFRCVYSAYPGAK